MSNTPISILNFFRVAIDDEYYCDIFPSAETDDFYDFFLCKHGYAIRTYMFGVKFNTAEEILDLALNNAPDYIELLEEKIDDE